LANDVEAARSALRIVNLSKTFPGQRALDDVDLEVTAGEIHALVGQNGSGKSTIVKILAGYHEPDEGATAEVAGVPFALGSATDALDAGLRFVHQDLGLVESMTVSDNFRITRRMSSLSLLNRGDERKAARRALDSLGYDIDSGFLQLKKEALRPRNATERDGSVRDHRERDATANAPYLFTIERKGIR